MLKKRRLKTLGAAYLGAFSLLASTCLTPLSASAEESSVDCNAILSTMDDLHLSEEYIIVEVGEFYELDIEPVEAAKPLGWEVDKVEFTNPDLIALHDEMPVEDTEESKVSADKPTQKTQDSSAAKKSKENADEEKNSAETDEATEEDEEEKLSVVLEGLQTGTTEIKVELKNPSWEASCTHGHAKKLTLECKTQTVPKGSKYSMGTKIPFQKSLPNWPKGQRGSTSTIGQKPVIKTNVSTNNNPDSSDKNQDDTNNSDDSDDSDGSDDSDHNNPSIGEPPSQPTNPDNPTQPNPGQNPDDSDNDQNPDDSDNPGQQPDDGDESDDGNTDDGDDDNKDDGTNNPVNPDQPGTPVDPENPDTPDNPGDSDNSGDANDPENPPVDPDDPGNTPVDPEEPDNPVDPPVTELKKYDTSGWDFDPEQLSFVYDGQEHHPVLIGVPEEVNVKVVAAEVNAGKYTYRVAFEVPEGYEDVPDMAVDYEITPLTPEISYKVNPLTGELELVTNGILPSDLDGEIKTSVIDATDTELSIMTVEPGYYNIKTQMQIAEDKKQNYTIPEIDRSEYLNVTESQPWLNFDLDYTEENGQLIVTVGIKDLKIPQVGTYDKLLTGLKLFYDKDRLEYVSQQDGDWSQYIMDMMSMNRITAEYNGAVNGGNPLPENSVVAVLTFNYKDPNDKADLVFTVDTFGNRGSNPQDICPDSLYGQSPQRDFYFQSGGNFVSVANPTGAIKVDTQEIWNDPMNDAFYKGKDANKDASLEYLQDYVDRNFTATPPTPDDTDNPDSSDNPDDSNNSDGSGGLGGADDTNDSSVSNGENGSVDPDGSANAENPDGEGNVNTSDDGIEEAPEEVVASETENDMATNTATSVASNDVSIETANTNAETSLSKEVVTDSVTATALSADTSIVAAASSANTASAPSASVVAVPSNSSNNSVASAPVAESLPTAVDAAE